MIKVFLCLMTIVLASFIPCLAQPATPEQPVASENNNNHIDPVQQIESLPKDIDSLSKLLTIVDQNPNPNVAQAAMKLVYELNPNQPEVLAAFWYLFFHAQPSVADTCKVMLMNDTWQMALREILRSGSYEEKTKTAAVFVQVGISELGSLTELLESSAPEDQLLACNSLRELGKSNPIAVLHNLLVLSEINTDPGMQTKITALIHDIAKTDISAILIVSRDITGEVSRTVIANTLENLGKDIVKPSLMVLQNHPDADMSKLLEMTFKKMDASIVRDLLLQFENSNHQVRTLIIATLQFFGPKAVEQITLSFTDPAAPIEQQQLALTILAMMGTHARSAFPLIKDFISRRNSPLQLPALQAIETMGDASQEIVSELQYIFRVSTTNELVRASAARCLANAGPAAKQAIPDLQNRLRYDNGEFKEPYIEVRRAICQALGNIGAASLSAVPQLVYCLGNDDEQVARMAAEAIGKIAADTDKNDPAFQDAIDPIVRNFSNCAAKDNEPFAKALAKIMQKSTSYSSRLLRTVRTDPDPLVRTGIICAFKYLGKAGQHSVPTLTNIIRWDKDDTVREESANALAEVGPNSDSIRVLLEKVRDDSPSVRLAVAKALSRMGPNVMMHVLRGFSVNTQDHARLALLQTIAYFNQNESYMTTKEAPKEMERAVAELNKQLPNWNAVVQKEAIITLCKIGEPAISAIPTIMEVLKTSDDRELHVGVRSALPQFGAAIVPFTLQMLKEDNPLCQETAIFIAGKLGNAIIPDLILLMQETKDPELLKYLIPIVGKNPNTIDVLLQKLENADGALQEILSNTIAKTGSIAIPKILNIIKKHEQPESRIIYQKILVKIGTPAVNGILTAIKETDSSNVELRIFWLNTIGQIGPKAQRAILPLFAYVVEWKDDEQLAAAKNLGKIGEAVIPYALRLLSNEDKKVQELGLMILQETKSPLAVAYLLKTLKDPRWMNQVIHASVKMQDVALPVLMKSISDPNPTIRFACAVALNDINNKSTLEAIKTQEAIEENVMIKYILSRSIEQMQK